MSEKARAILIEQQREEDRAHRRESTCVAAAVSGQYFEQHMFYGQFGKNLTKEQGVSMAGRKATKFLPEWFAVDNS